MADCEPALGGGRLLKTVIKFSATPLVLGRDEKEAQRLNPQADKMVEK
jgi:hypothetical protein